MKKPVSFLLYACVTVSLCLRTLTVQIKSKRQHLPWVPFPTIEIWNLGSSTIEIPNLSGQGRSNSPNTGYCSEILLQSRWG